MTFSPVRTASPDGIVATPSLMPTRLVTERELRDPFYSYAPNEAALRKAFRQVADKLSKARLPK